MRIRKIGAFVLMCISIFCSCAHQMGVYTRRWAGSQPAGEVMFVSNGWLQADDAKKRGTLTPDLFQLRDQKWKQIEQRLFEEAVYAPFVSAPWFFLQLPEGPQTFRISLGNIDQEIPVAVKEKTIHIVPFLITVVDTIKEKGRTKYIFSFLLKPEVTLPFFDCPGAEAELANALDSGEPGVRYRACRELEKLRRLGALAAATTERLSHLAKNDAVELVREGAEKALGI